MRNVLAVVMSLTLIATTVCAEKTKVRWFVGLGAGTDAPTIEPQKAVVEKFNKSQNEIELILEIVGGANNTASNVLATEIAGGNAPDIVGPVGIRGRDSFKGAWLDLDPLVKASKLDLSQFDPAMVNFYRTKDEGLVGLPFAIYPSFLYVNKALFKEAGLPLPPQKFGEPYIDEKGVKRVWDLNTLREISLKLTVDANGNDATSPKFDKTRIVQFGYDEQFADLRGCATLFGAGTFVAADGKSAQIPANWAVAFKWYQDAMWKDVWQPNYMYVNSDTFGKGDAFASGRIAMAHTHLWYAGFAQIQKLDWDLAVVPSYNGKVTARMHADTFEITRYSKNKEAAFKVLTYLLTTAAPDLLKIYGGMPAKKSSQTAFLADFFKTKFPGISVNTQIIMDSVAYPDNPNHEGYMPSLIESITIYTNFWNKVMNDPQFDLNAGQAQLKDELTKIFKAVK